MAPDGLDACGGMLFITKIALTSLPGCAPTVGDPSLSSAMKTLSKDGSIRGICPCEGPRLPGM